MTISETLDKTVRLYRANFVPLISIGALGAGLGLPALLLDGKPHAGMTMANIGLGLFGIVFVVAMFLLVPLQYGTMMSASLAIVEGQRPNLGRDFGIGWQRLGTVCWAHLLVALAGGFALILLIFPGFYVWLGFALTIAALIESTRRGERISATAAMRRSWQLSQGLRGRLFGLFFVWGLLQIVMSFAIGGLLGLVGIDGLPRDLSKQLSSAFISPCYGLSLALIYTEARSFREGRDLAQQAARLAQAEPGPGGVPAV
jgi:hypothetical protein